VSVLESVPVPGPVPGPMPSPLLVPIEVRWRDLDALGHINNAEYFTYFECARTTYGQALLAAGGEHWAASGQLPAGFQFIIASASCEFRSQAYLGEALQVAIWASQVGHKSFVFDYRITVPDTGRLVAEGRTTQVWYDYAAGHSLPVPAEVVARMEQLQGGPIPRK
jgi:acyl-CoA thioester hydrolase